MENSKFNNQLQEYQERVNQIIFNPRFELLEKFILEDQQGLRQLLISSYDTSFFLKLQKDLLAAKSQIITELHTCFHCLEDGEVRLFRNKIRPLTQQTRTILRQGVIGIYSDLQELRQKLNPHQQKKDFVILLTQSLKSLQVLLRDHFILKQIEKLDNKLLSNHSLKQILSEKNINSSNSLTSINSIHSIKQLISDHALKEITRTIESKSITRLISEQLKGEESEIEQVLQMCRICKNTFKIRHLQKHINYCTKIQAYNSRRQQVIQNQLKLIEQMKRYIEKKTFGSTNISEQLEDDGEIGKIYRKIIESFEETPKHRRSSAVGEKHRKKVVKRISLDIDEFLRFQNKNEHLQNFRMLMRERELIQKKVLSLQNNYLHYRMENDCSENSQLSQSSIRKTIKSLKTSKLVSIKTKKSLFARKQNSQSSRSDTKIHQYIQETQKLNSFKVHMDEIINLSDQSSDNLKQRLYKSLSNITGACEEQKTKQISFNDFQIIRFLGKGAFGKVYMARRKKTKDIYALKVVKFQQNSDQKQFASLQNENEILSQIGGQYLVKAPFSFTEGSAHFFVLQYMPGGDLAKLIQEKVYLDCNEAKFYLAEIVLALEKLHEMGIIHRDLKPENLIFDEKGHLKLTDFGLSQIRINDKIRRVRKRNQIHQESKLQIQDRAKFQELSDKKSKLKSALIEGKNKVKIIGTPDYIAPEIINGESLDNLSIDWWSLGVIAYEMMVGCRPFCANTIDQVIQNISNYNIEWPQIGEEDDMINPLAADFIKKLLNPNYRQRLGSQSSVELKKHPFFEGIVWQEVKTCAPPIRRVMDRKQKYEYNEQNLSLREQILSAIGNSKIKSSFKLDNFVRYDILIEQTLDSADRQIIKHENKIKKLKSIVENIYNFDGNQNEYEQSSNFRRERKKAKSSFSLGSECLVYAPPEDEESTYDRIEENSG